QFGPPHLRRVPHEPVRTAAAGDLRPAARIAGAVAAGRDGESARRCLGTGRAELVGGAAAARRETSSVRKIGAPSGSKNGTPYSSRADRRGGQGPRDSGPRIASLLSMVRGLSRSLLAFLIVAPLLANAANPPAADPARVTILQRFLALDDPVPTQCRALRHLEARNDKFDMRAWMDVWTEIDASGFRYRIVAEEGSDSIRNHAFREPLHAEP